MSTVPTSLSVQPLQRPQWSQIDTVLLDMDGTVLDLQFDNYFWLHLVPERFAQRHALTLETARQELTPRFAARQGTLDWYCTDFWSRDLGLDIAALKHEVRERVEYLPGAEQFLVEMRRRGLRTALLTNAHRDALRVKDAQSGVAGYFDIVVSSHDYGAPKESAEFWRRAQAGVGFDPARSLFVDDSLAVLRAARAHGIGQIYAITHPDSAGGYREVVEFPSVPRVADLLG